MLERTGFESLLIRPIGSAAGDVSLHMHVLSVVVRTDKIHHSRESATSATTFKTLSNRTHFSYMTFGLNTLHKHSHTNKRIRLSNSTIYALFYTCDIGLKRVVNLLPGYPRAVTRPGPGYPTFAIHVNTLFKFLVHEIKLLKLKK